MYNIKDILDKTDKDILEKNNINYDYIVESDEDMKKFCSNVFRNVVGFHNIEIVCDTIIDYHNEYFNQEDTTK